MPASGLPDLVAQAYEAACDSTGMSEFVERTAAYFGAQQSALTICPNGNTANIIAITHGVSADEVRALYVESDQPKTISARLRETPAGTTVSLDGYARPTKMKSLPARRATDSHGSDVHVLGGVVIADDGNRCELLLFRDAAQGDFSPSEHDALRVLMHYLRRAIELSMHFTQVLAEHQTALSVLDNAPRSIMLLDKYGRVSYQNQAARELLIKDDGFYLDGGRFGIHDADAHARVEEYLRTTGTAIQQDSESQRLMTVAANRNGGSPYKLIMYTLPDEHPVFALIDQRLLTVIVIYDPATMNQLNAELLRRFYLLTGAECALAKALYRGRSLPEASADLGISINTSRTQLRSIFRKVGVHSQAALLQELAKSFINT